MENKRYENPHSATSNALLSMECTEEGLSDVQRHTLANAQKDLNSKVHQKNIGLNPNENATPSSVFEADRKVMHFENTRPTTSGVIVLNENEKYVAKQTLESCGSSKLQTTRYVVKAARKCDGRNHEKDVVGIEAVAAKGIKPCKQTARKSATGFYTTVTYDSGVSRKQSVTTLKIFSANIISNKENLSAQSTSSMGMLQVSIDLAGEKSLLPEGMRKREVLKRKASEQQLQNHTKRQKPMTPTIGIGGQFMVSLNHYFYGQMQGSPKYWEEKGYFKFKCWYCHKVLGNNIRMMVHLQGHLERERQHNLDLSDITHCRHCHKHFHTPYLTQKHMDRVHGNNPDILICRICDTEFDHPFALRSHMFKDHDVCEMPYVCQLCGFRSSIWSDLVDHFKVRHDSSCFIICLYCLKIFHVKFHCSGTGLTMPYYQHLLKHQTKSLNKKCGSCNLMFLSKEELREHKIKDHALNGGAPVMDKLKACGVGDKVPVPVLIYDCGSVNNNPSPAMVGRCTQHSLQLKEVAVDGSYECKECCYNFGQVSHISKLTKCALCMYTTACSFSWDQHMRVFHSGNAGAKVEVVRSEKSLDEIWSCACGFASAKGNQVAYHLMKCSRSIAYRVPRIDAPTEEDKVDDGSAQPEEPIGMQSGLLFNALGLVPKDDNLATVSG